MAAIHIRAFAPDIGPEASEGVTWGKPWGEAAFAVQLGLPGALGLIDPAGGLLLARLVAEEAEVLTLAVAPEARRLGLGRALLQWAMVEAVQAGAKRIVLEVAATNAPARALYTGAGFREVGRRRAYYADRSDALVLAAALPGAG
ncbi:MAG: GNAT family N-acetyltransferase [Rhodospirillales bacterium]|nr:GNAT family N-acetyltransferase [Rhodospirillales bacterium]